MSKIRIITAALPYVNFVPHLGHLIGSHLPADIFARFSRLMGYETYFVGGTDENGAATEFAAVKEGLTPQQICDKYYEIHKKIYFAFNISYDNFSRTSKEIHHKFVQDFFINLYKNGFITERLVKQAYCNNCKKGLADRFITGTCPHCGYVNADGDQCESCGTVLNPIDLLMPKCAICQKQNISFDITKHLFLKIDSAIPKIETWVNNNDYLRSWVKSLTNSWIKKGIEERCITRDLVWGIKIPLKGYEHKVFYVWFDNVMGYISSTIELLGKEKAISLWKNESVENYYFVGKDNIPFHTIFWPGAIIGDKRFHMPTNVSGYQFLNFEGKKFSKSKNVGIFLDKVIASNIPIDYWRFYLTYILTETSDADFIICDFKERINKELIGNFGNYVNRVLNLIYVKCNSIIPTVKQRDTIVELEIDAYVKQIITCYNKLEFRSALYNILKFSDFGNRHLNTYAPWKSGDYTLLAYNVEIIRLLAIVLSPIIPETTDKIFELLNTNNKAICLDLDSRSIKKPEILFKKLEDQDILCFKN